MEKLESKSLANLIINVLKERKLTDKVNSEEVHLLLGTCAVESNFGQYRKQIKGPARGIFQIEPFTGCDLLDRVLASKKYTSVYTWCLHRMNMKYSKGNKIVLGDTLINDDELSIVLCRVKYLTDKHTIPNTLQGIAEMWKRVYNTYLGKGTVEEFIKKYNKYVGNFSDIDYFLKTKL